MKILLFHDYSIPVGGACRAFYDDADMLVGKGHTVYLFTLGQASGKNNLLKKYKYQTVYIEPSENSIAHFFLKYFSLRLYKTFKQTVKLFGPDIIHIHNNLKSTLSIISAARESHVPVIHTMHDANLACISGYGVNKKTG